MLFHNDVAVDQAGYIHQHIPIAFFIAPGHGAVDLKTDGGSKDVFISAMTTPRKNMKVSWDYDFQYMESHKIHVPNHQPANILLISSNSTSYRFRLLAYGF